MIFFSGEGGGSLTPFFCLNHLVRVKLGYTPTFTFLGLPVNLINIIVFLHRINVSRANKFEEITKNVGQDKSTKPNIFHKLINPRSHLGPNCHCGQTKMKIGKAEHFSLFIICIVVTFIPLNTNSKHYKSNNILIL